MRLALAGDRGRISPELVLALGAAGFVALAEGADRFGLRDLILLRSAQAAADAGISLERIMKALERLRSRLPPGAPLTALTLSVECGELVVREGGAKWTPDLTQAVLDFGAEPRRASPPSSVPSAPPSSGPVPGRSNVRQLFQDATSRSRIAVNPTPSVESTFQEACALEEAQPELAMDRYRVVLQKAPDHADAHVNLGRLLQVRGQSEEAERHYRTALALSPRDATAAFNLGTALEDQGRWEGAIQAYATAVTIDPHCADAHYNLACLYEKTGRKAQAIRHLISARASRPR